MPITLTCRCGQKQYVAPEFAGQTVACVMCGNTLKVPAMGVPATAKARPAAKPNVLLPLALLGGGMLLLLTLSGAWLTWALLNSVPDEPTRIALDDDPPPRRQTPADEPKREEKKPDEQKPPSRVDHPSKEEKKPLIAPFTPKALPKQVIEPVTPPDRPTPVVKPLLPNDQPMALVKPVPIEPTKKPPINVIEPVKLVWKLREGEVFYQELSVTQKPTFKVAGVPIAMIVQYQVYSRFTVKKQNKDGSLVVEQKIESARFVQADDLSKPTIVASLLQLAGTTYTLELSPQMDVTKFDGAKDNPQPKNVQLAGGVGIQSSSLIDRDGWKELAQATFFQLDQTPTANQRWAKPMTHNWGSMGSWQGKTHYMYIGQEKNEHLIRFGQEMTYKAPAAGAGPGMMKINGADFKPQQANGVIRFDSAKGRVTYAEELFHVKGILNVNLLGQNQLVEIDEQQHFVIRIHDKLP